jgi:hypothetical protein
MNKELVAGEFLPGHTAHVTHCYNSNRLANATWFPALECY